MGYAEEAIVRELPQLRGLVRVEGLLVCPPRLHGNTYYDVKIGTPQSWVAATIPRHLVPDPGLAAGVVIAVTGAVRASNNPNSLGCDFRIQGSRVELIRKGLEHREEDAHAGAALSLVALKNIAVQRNQFPTWPRSKPITVAVIHPSSSKAVVLEDCMAHLRRVDSVLAVSTRAVNMLDPRAIAGAICEAGEDVLLLIRGGGDDRTFSVFDDPRVVQAMAKSSAYRILGVGHSANRTILDFLVDHVASTPTAAGQHVVDCIARVTEPYRRANEQVKAKMVELDQQIARQSSRTAEPAGYGVAEMLLRSSRTVRIAAIAIFLIGVGVGLWSRW